MNQKTVIIIAILGLLVAGGGLYFGLFYGDNIDEQEGFETNNSVGEVEVSDNDTVFITVDSDTDRIGLYNGEEEITLTTTSTTSFAYPEDDENDIFVFIEKDGEKIIIEEL